MASEMSTRGSDEITGAIKPPAYLRTLHERDQEKRLIIILEQASLEVVKKGRDYVLLNPDRHKDLMKKYKKDPTQCRPDITHQCLLMLLDSPLNRAGLLQVYIHTEKNILIEVNPQTRIPRTFERFSGLMVQLLHKMYVKSSEASQIKLLKVIKNPVMQYLPTGCTKIATSFHVDEVTDIKTLVPQDKPIVFVVGAMAKGSLSPDYTEKTVSISNYPLSAALTCTKICSAFEELWGII